MGARIQWHPLTFHLYSDPGREDSQAMASTLIEASDDKRRYGPCDSTRPSRANRTPQSCAPDDLPFAPRARTVARLYVPFHGPRDWSEGKKAQTGLRPSVGGLASWLRSGLYELFPVEKSDQNFSATFRGLTDSGKCPNRGPPQGASLAG